MGDGLKERTANGLMWGAINGLSSQLLSVMIGIVLARLLTPAEYGIVGMLAFFSAIAGSLQESGFIAALTNLKQATNRDYNAVFWFCSLAAIIIYVVLFFCSPLIARFFHQPELIALSRLVFASLLMSGIGIAHAAYMFRNMMNREKAITGFFALVGSGIVGITLALNGYSYWSLAWQQFTYIFIINIGRLYFVRWLPSLHIDFTPIREMIGFSSKILITNIINQINNNILSFIFGRLFTAGDVGNYTQAAKWNTMGYSLISGTMQQVAQPVLASINEEENRQLNVFRKMLRFTALISMPAMLGLAFIADFIVVLLGEQWADSVTLLRLLCISGAFLPIHTLYQNLFISHGRSDTYMWCTIALVITQIVVVMVFASWGIEVMIAAYVATLVLWTGVWQVLTYKLIQFRFLDLLKDVCPFLLATLASIAVAYYATLAISNTIGLILSRIVITSLLYVAIMKIAHVKIFQECIQFLFKHHETNH